MGDDDALSARERAPDKRSNETGQRSLSDDFAMPMHDQRGPPRKAERHADIVERERLMQRYEICLAGSLCEYERKARRDRRRKQRAEGK